MRKYSLLLSIAGLAVLGLIDSAYLTHSAITGSALSCGIAGLDGCNVVAQSGYSRLFGIPLAEYGLAFYGLILLLALFSISASHRFISHALHFFAGVGALFSLYFIGLQIFAIKALCVYCLGSFVIATLIFVLSQRHWRPVPDTVTP